MNRQCLKVYSGPWKLVGSHWTAPVTMIREGILAGSDGPMFWPSSVIRAMASLWDGVPVVVGHPMGSNDLPISVKQVPEQIIGHVVNPIFDSFTKSLKATIRIPAGLNGVNQIMMLKECSIGVFVDSLIGHGQFQGQSYVGQTRRATPDHLAILPEGQVGACSWSEHGCGIRVHNEVDELRAIAAQTMTNLVNHYFKGEPLMGNHEEKEAVYPAEVHEEQDDLATLASWENCGPNMLPPPEITLLKMKHEASRQRPGSGHQAHAMYPPGVE